jgi:hypothetical protein
MRFAHIALLFPLAALTACNGGSPAPVGSTSAGLTGPIELRMTNIEENSELIAELSTAAHVVVTIAHIDARLGDRGDEDDAGWIPILNKMETVDLLSLGNGTFGTLGIGTFPSGNLEQLRLFVSQAGPNYVVTADGVTHPLVVPSSAVRVVGEFDTESCSTGHITLEFAGRHSIVLAPADGKTSWMLRPVIRLREVVTGCPSEDRDDRAAGGVEKTDRK